MQKRRNHSRRRRRRLCSRHNGGSRDSLCRCATERAGRRHGLVETLSEGVVKGSMEGCIARLVASRRDVMKCRSLSRTSSRLAVASIAGAVKVATKNSLSARGEACRAAVKAASRERADGAYGDCFELRCARPIETLSVLYRSSSRQRREAIEGASRSTWTATSIIFKYRWTRRSRVW